MPDMHILSMQKFGNSFSRFNGSAVRDMIDMNQKAINDLLNSEIQMIENEIKKNEFPKNENFLNNKNVLENKNEILQNEKNLKNEIVLENEINIQQNVIVKSTTSNTIVMLRDREPYVYIELSPANSRRIYTGVDIMSPIESIWEVLTAFDSLQNVVPSLVKNEVYSYI